MIALPVDAFVDDVLRHVRERRAVVITAAPGAGKTTRIPPALAADGRVLLLQPRRVAARSIARRIAEERGWSIGREVGWHVRFERRYSAETRLLVATEGVLTSRLLADPLLSDISTVVIDEFHERSIHADLGIALARQAWIARGDLRLVVMSATLDATRVAEFLNDCPVVEVPGRLHPIDVSYRPGVEMEAVIAEAFPRAGGAVLCFLPGAPEIRRTMDRLSSLVQRGVPVFPLHGSLSADDQDCALEPSDTPRVILATNIAETTLTVPDVRVIVDGGWQKVARYDAARGVDSLETERISRDAADQRAGRAGRLGPGSAVRLWDSRDRLRAHREPEIARIDLAAVVMDVLAWGGDPSTFEWFEAPPAEAIGGAVELLTALGAVGADRRLTALGRTLRRFPLHPRLARVLVAAGGAPEAARACAILSERHYLPASGRATACDLLAAADDPGALPAHIQRVAHEVRTIAESVLGRDATRGIPEDQFRRAVLAGYPDRVARRRAPASDRFVLSSGTGARLGRESGVYAAEFVVAVDVTRAAAGHAAGSPDAIVRLATAVERDWIEPTSVDTAHELDRSTGAVRAVRTERHGAIVLSQVSVPADQMMAGDLVAEAYLAQGPREEDEQLRQRLDCIGQSLSPAEFADLVRAASRARPNLNEVDVASQLPPDTRRRLDREAPIDLPLPSGRHARLSYHRDGRIVASVKLQELFGLGDTPRLGRSRRPVTFELLAPNGRPVQVTSDLKSFWNSGYQEIRKELRARYPKHPWPEDPWTAVPTHRTIRRRLN